MNKDTLTTKNGLLYRNGKVVLLPEADYLARAHGCIYAEHMVRILEKQASKEPK